jgi:hypothetical protein
MKGILLMLSCILLNPNFQSKQADDIIGTWRLEVGLDLNIYKIGEVYEGRIVALNNFNDGQILDEHNPEKGNRLDSLKGKIIMKNLKYDLEEKTWNDGTMYAPHKGMTVDLEIKEASDLSITAVGSKYIFWHTDKWLKLN